MIAGLSTGVVGFYILYLKMEHILILNPLHLPHTCILGPSVVRSYCEQCNKMATTVYQDREENLIDMRTKLLLQQ